MTFANEQPLRILHLTDTHLFGDGRRHYGTADTEDLLRRTLSHLERLDELDLVVVSGDVSEDGSPASYRLAHGLIEPWAAARGAATAYAMGNHDRRPAFRHVLGDGQHLPDEASARSDSAPEDDRPARSVREVNGLRVIVLDSSVPGAGHGVVDEEQREWLRTVLAVPSPRGSVVVVHHPPVAAETELLGALALENPDALLEILRDGDVRAVLSGHYHFAAVEWRAGLPIVVSTAVANQARIFDDPRAESSGFGAGGSLLELSGAAGLRVLPFLVPDERAREEVFRIEPDRVEAIIDHLRAGRHD